MSKSLGNIVTMREFLETYNAEIYKWMILSTHYRSLCDFSVEAVDRAISGLARVYSALAMAEEFYDAGVPADPGFVKITDEGWKKVEESLSDDFNTPEAMAAMFEVVRVFNSQIKRGMKANPAIQGKAKAFVDFIHKVGKPMSLFQEKAAGFLLTLDNMLLVK